MNTACEVCNGSCCTFITMHMPDISEDEERWLSYHGDFADRSDKFVVEARCIHLWFGRCKIYDTRPQCCRDFKVGSPGCLFAINRKVASPRRQRVLDLVAEEEK